MKESTYQQLRREDNVLATFKVEDRQIEVYHLLLVITMVLLNCWFEIYLMNNMQTILNIPHF